MSFKDSAKAKFAALLSQDMLSFKAEGIDEPVYYRPVGAMNSVQAERLRGYRDKGTVSALAEIIILRARNENGTKMFLPSELSEMLELYSATLLAEVVTGMSEETPDPK